jgi:hypothetical protein
LFIAGVLLLWIISTIRPRLLRPLEDRRQTAGKRFHEHCDLGVLHQRMRDGGIHFPLVAQLGGGVGVQLRDMRHEPAEVLCGPQLEVVFIRPGTQILVL